MTTPRPTTPAYQHGRDDIATAFVLSAPGQREAEDEMPAAGRTGDTLNDLLRILHRRDPVRFPSTDKAHYRIVNAVEDVHFARATGRTEGYTSELKAPENLDRLRRALQDKAIVVAFGDKARLALEAAGIAVAFAAPHLSLQRINTFYRSRAVTRADRVADRLGQLADALLGSGAGPDASQA